MIRTAPSTRHARPVAALTAALLAFASTSALAQAAPDQAVIPQPQAISPAAGVFTIGPDTPVVAPPGDAEASQAAARLVELLSQTNGVSLTQQEGAAGPGVVFRRDPSLRAEGYRLQVSPDAAVISGADLGGLLYGAVTFWQLASADPQGRVQAVEIVDAPRFRWRGLMLDSARHYQSPDFIRRFIDWMAAHKLNTLHWHLTDDQGWRLEIRRYPKLTEVGAWRVPAGAAALEDLDPATGQPRRIGGYYTQDEVRDLVAYAAVRNITIVPEIDLPGHASAAIAAYPELAVQDAPNSEVAAVPADWGVYPNLFSPEENTLEFLEHVLDEVMELFPSEYIHLGGDEAVKDQWRASPSVQARMRDLGVADEEALQSWFIGRLERHINARGRRMIGWDEILEGGLAPDATVMSWRGVAGAVEAARLGHDTVMSPAPTLYLDHRQSAADGAPGRGEPMTLERIYRFDPTPDEMTSEQAARVLGVQANLWTEHMRDEARVAYQAFPRVSAVAEIAWTAPERLDWTGFQTRLQPQLKRYEDLGIDYARLALTPEAGPPPPDGERRYDHQMRLCSSGLVLSLIDDAPVHGERPSLMMDIMNPCWIYEGADLENGADLRVAVGQIPFNFQIGEAIHNIRLPEPRTAEGELEVRIGGCEVEPALVIPLAQAAASHELTVLEGRLPARAGRHDLCLKFAQAGLDPMWGLDWVRVGGAR